MEVEPFLMSTEPSPGSARPYQRQRLFRGLERCFDVPLSLSLLSQRAIRKLSEVLQGELRGSVYLDRRLRNGLFSESDQQLLLELLLLVGQPLTRAARGQGGTGP